jgi:hypothetical protein
MISDETMKRTVHGLRQDEDPPHGFGPDLPTPVEEIVGCFEALKFSDFDHEWVSILTESLIEKFGHKRDDPQGMAWLHRALQPILCCVRERYRGKEAHKKEIHPRGLRLAREMAPLVGDVFLVKEMGNKYTKIVVSSAARASDEFAFVPGTPHRDGYIVRVKE